MLTHESIPSVIEGQSEREHEAPSSTGVTVGLLRKIDFLSGVDDDLLVEIAARSNRRQLKADTALFHAGEPGHILFMVISGWVRIEKVSNTGQVLVIGKRGPGTQLGELALFDGSPRMADAVTETECELLSLDRKDFLHCLVQSPSASLAVMASLADMVRTAGANLESFRALDTLGRLSDLLIWYCDCQGTPDSGESVRINQRLTLQKLADQVGVARETISRSFKVLVDLGVVRRSGHSIIVLSPKKLRQIVAG